MRLVYLEILFCGVTYPNCFGRDGMDRIFFCFIKKLLDVSPSETGPEGLPGSPKFQSESTHYIIYTSHIYSIYIYICFF